MATTTGGNSDSLPGEVEDLIDRRLRLMRRQEEIRLNEIKTAMGRSVVTHVRVGFDSNKNNAAIALSTLAAYHDAAAKILQVTEEWPDAVWGTISPVLDCVSITPRQGDAIAKLLYTHAWQPDDGPWTAHWVDADGFAGLVQRVMGRYGLPAADFSSDFERQLSLESSKIQADFANRGRIALGETQAALDECLLACRGDDTAAPAIPEASSVESLSAIARKTANASHVEADGTRIEARQIDTNSADEPTYIPYPKAMKMLSESLGATPAELAVWASFGDTPGCGGITAFWEASTTDNPRILRFDCWSEADFDYVAPLMGAWFVLEDIVSFQPADRYIEYSSLVERWRTSENIPDVPSYISAKVREDRLHEVHPVTGHSQLSLSDDEYPRPARETTLLDLADVKTVELEEEIRPASAETPTQQVAGDGDESCLSQKSRREQRKRETQAMYQDWQAEYQRLRESHPGKSKKWCANQIARLEMARGRDSETIRRRLR